MLTALRSITSVSGGLFGLLVGVGTFYFVSWTTAHILREKTLRWSQKVLKAIVLSVTPVVGGLAALLAVVAVLTIIRAVQQRFGPVETSASITWSICLMGAGVTLFIGLITRSRVRPLPVASE